jgi:F0F1-type ATP synthase assembly protein I
VAEDSNRPGRSNALVSAARYSEIGFIIPAAVFLGYALGRLGDYWLHTHWLYLAGVIFGAVVGFAQMIRMASALSKDKTES